MKISVVTISYNQGPYLQSCIDSVSRQEQPWEHIVVDAGSTDGSRELIERNKTHFSQIILEPDEGPADGLNKGFARASGEIFYYLNADDLVYPGAFQHARSFFERRQDVGVVSGHGEIVDSRGDVIRRCWSEPVGRQAMAHSGVILIQPSTFIRRRDYERVGGFNRENRSNWDDELVVDMFLAGSKFAVVEEFWSGYRVHSESITGTGRLAELVKAWSHRRYTKITGRALSPFARMLMRYYNIRRVLGRPEALKARLVGGRVHGGTKQK